MPRQPLRSDLRSFHEHHILPRLQAGRHRLRPCRPAFRLPSVTLRADCDGLYATDADRPPPSLNFTWTRGAMRSSIEGDSLGTTQYPLRGCHGPCEEKARGRANRSAQTFGLPVFSTLAPTPRPSGRSCTRRSECPLIAPRPRPRRRSPAPAIAGSLRAPRWASTGRPPTTAGSPPQDRWRPSCPTAGALALRGRRHRCRSRVSLFGHSERLYGLPMHIYSERRVQWPFHGNSQRAVNRPFNTATHHTRYRATAFGLSVRSPFTTLRAVTPCAFEGHTARQPSAQTFGLSIDTLVTTALQSAVRIAAFCSNPTPEASASRSRSRRIVRFRRRRHRMEVPTSPPRHG